MRRGTYSIVARDSATGELGVAVQSHWFSVGSQCAWARAGVGAVATQSIIEPAYGPRTFDRLAAGDAAPDALASQLAQDRLAAMRQVAVIDARGRTAVHTGSGCIPYASHVAGEDVTCQANMMARDTVPAAMLDGYRLASGTLADRLLAALQAAEGQGGDVRGRQSAVLLVVPAAGEWWRQTVSVRVEDHHDPVAELGRLLRLHAASRPEDAAAGRALGPSPSPTCFR